MNFPPKVLRWESAAQSEILRGGYPFPVEFVLSVILAESGGDCGEVNPNSGASGLMQVIRNTLETYNNNNSPNVSIETMRSTDTSDGAAQIRVGLWVLGHYLKRAYRWVASTNPQPGVSDIMRVDTIMYLRGPGRIYDKFGHLQDRRWSQLVASDPDWKFWGYPRRIWKWTQTNNDPVWDMPAINRWVNDGPQPPPPPPPPPPPVEPPLIAGSKNGFLLALIILGVGSYYLKKWDDSK